MESTRKFYDVGERVYIAIRPDNPIREPLRGVIVAVKEMGCSDYYTVQFKDGSFIEVHESQTCKRKPIYYNCHA